MNSQGIINDLLAQGQEELTPELQDRMIAIITGNIIFHKLYFDNIQKSLYE